MAQRSANHGKHIDIIREKIDIGEEVTRDMFLSKKDAQNLANKFAYKINILEKNNTKSVHMWVQKHCDMVFFYYNTNVAVKEELIGSNMPCTIGIQHKWQRKMMLIHGYNWAIFVDATFGMNEKKVCPPT